MGRQGVPNGEMMCVKVGWWCDEVVHPLRHCRCCLLIRRCRQCTQCTLQPHLAISQLTPLQAHVAPPSVEQSSTYRPLLRMRRLLPSRPAISDPWPRPAPHKTMAFTRDHAPDFLPQLSSSPGPCRLASRRRRPLASTSSRRAMARRSRPT